MVLPLPARSVPVVLGTRPEAVKLAGVVRLLGEAAWVVHTGQHYDPALWSAVAVEVGLPAPALSLAVGGTSRGRQVGEATAALDDAFGARGGDLLAVVVQGDTNAALSAALAANARGLPLVHVEAGLRSFDRRMPEEHNRVVVDHLADLLCAPTETSRANLLAEGLPDGRVTVTGNTVVEAVHALLPDAAARAAVCAAHGVDAGGFVLATLHRPENADDPEVLGAVLDDLRSLGVPVLLPLHPRTRARRPDTTGLLVVDPLPPRDFLALQAESALLVSDSGGVQEEASVLGRPVLVVRRSTERPEVLGTVCELVQPGARLRALAAERLADVAGWRSRLEALPSPYGDGSASRRTVDALRALVGR